MNEIIRKIWQIFIISVRLPKPGSRMLRVSTITNCVAGAGLIAYGLLSAHRWTIIPGIIGVCNGFVINRKFG